MTITWKSHDDYGKATRPSGLHDVPDSQRAEHYQAMTPRYIKANTENVVSIHSRRNA